MDEKGVSQADHRGVIIIATFTPNQFSGFVVEADKVRIFASRSAQAVEVSILEYGCGDVGFHIFIAPNRLGSLAVAAVPYTHLKGADGVAG